MMGVVRERHDPILRARVRQQPLERLDDGLRFRIGELAVDEIVEHVDNDQSTHQNLPVIASQSKTRAESTIASAGAPAHPLWGTKLPIGFALGWGPAACAPVVRPD